MKYIKIFIALVISTSCLNLHSTICATEKLEDLSLSRIYVEPGNLEPEFSETRDYYTLLLNNDVTNLLVQATPTNENLKYEIKGNETLKSGENFITITVYSEDNTRNKVYTINALRTNEPDKYNALLSTLIVDNYPFNEEFFPERFNYTTKNNTNDNKVEVFAYSQNPNASVEITSNENLEDGKNVISVIVTSENGLAKREYNITINKSDISNEVLQANLNNDESINNSENISTNSFLKNFIISFFIIIIVFILNIIIIKTKK